MTSDLRARGISRIGLNLSPESEEYPFWALLGAPEADLQIEWVDVDTPSARYLNQSFEPEAIICENCSPLEMARYADDYMHMEYETIDLFIGEE